MASRLWPTRLPAPIAIWVNEAYAAGSPSVMVTTYTVPTLMSAPADMFTKVAVAMPPSSSGLSRR